jgi:hypothetical protein
MAEIDSVQAKFKQPLRCKCGRALTSSDFRAVEECIEIVCSGCHSEVAEIECGIRGDYW